MKLFLVVFLLVLLCVGLVQASNPIIIIEEAGQNTPQIRHSQTSSVWSYFSAAYFYFYKLYELIF